jgi:multimeric flavodoxin WrbA
LEDVKMKKITLINGISDDKYLSFEEQLENMCGRSDDNVKYECFTIRKKKINYCCGCWNCWVKTPGECLFKDDMPEILRSIINSDMTVFISPVVMGFVSAQLKKINDRMVPMVHPYIGIFEEECHHQKRYDKYPKLGLILLDEKAQEIEEFSIITDIYKRLALNMKTGMMFTGLNNESLEVLENEINNNEWFSQRKKQ